MKYWAKNLHQNGPTVLIKSEAEPEVDDRKVMGIYASFSHHIQYIEMVDAAKLKTAKELLTRLYDSMYMRDEKSVDWVTLKKEINEYLFAEEEVK